MKEGINMLKGYLATNFFNEATFEWTKKVGYRLRSLGLDIYIPQENGEINDKSADDAAEVTDIDIANGDNFYLEGSNILIACLDGVEIDSGVSAEIGYFSGLARAEEMYCASPPTRKIIGIYTDIRRDGEGDNRFYINLYTKGLVKLRGKVVHSSNEMADAVMELIEQIKKEEQFRRKI
jgi:Nucleoside 2-deoxyribosyltransferase